MNLDSIFTSIVYKILVQVDLPGGSHQHELNGVEALRSFFNSDTELSGEINWSYHQDGTDVITGVGDFKFYDSRAKGFEKAGRSEWRMYYSGDFLKNANIGDLLILGRTKENKVYGFVIQKDTNWQRAAQTLFNLEVISDKLQFISDKDLSDDELDFYRQCILSELGLEVGYIADSHIDKLADQVYNEVLKNKGKFPSTISMAKYAWNNTKFDIKNSDDTLITWLDYESRLFYGIEKMEVQEHIDKGFSGVDEFISYSLSVQNRRKSRMGFSLQNHLGNIFELRKVKFQAQKFTEGKNQPDFIFPGIQEYKDPRFDEINLFMLAAKSTCKDRWRQILTEAKRISTKHLCTLEQSISTEQMSEIKSRSVKLVIPNQFRKVYTSQQQVDILNIEDFIQLVKLTQ